MADTIKKLVLGAVPIVCGGSGAVALGENITWPEVPSPRLSFQATTPTTMPALSADEAHAERIRREARQGQLDALIGNPRVVPDKAEITYGIRP